jgi:hypothetical protein
MVEGGTSASSPVGQQLSGTYAGNMVATSSFERTNPSLDRLTSRGMALQEIIRPVFGAANDDAGESQPSSGDTVTLELESSGIDHVPRISTPPVRRCRRMKQMLQEDIRYHKIDCKPTKLSGITPMFGKGRTE